jgi:hypothetical protein
MNFLMVILRLIHIFSGVFWAGTSFFNLAFLANTVNATGDSGRMVFQHLVFKTRFAVTMLTLALLTFLSGLLMYWRLSGFRPGYLTTGYGLVLTLGAIAGLLALGAGYGMQYRVIQKMKAVRAEIEASGGPPSPEQMAKMQSLAQSAATGARVTTIFLVLALIGMSVAQYAVFSF